MMAKEPVCALFCVLELAASTEPCLGLAWLALNEPHAPVAWPSSSFSTHWQPWICWRSVGDTTRCGTVHSVVVRYGCVVPLGGTAVWPGITSVRRGPVMLVVHLFGARAASQWRPAHRGLGRQSPFGLRNPENLPCGRSCTPICLCPARPVLHACRVETRDKSAGDKGRQPHRSQLCTAALDVSPLSLCGLTRTSRFSPMNRLGQPTQLLSHKLTKLSTTRQGPAASRLPLRLIALP